MHKAMRITLPLASTLVATAMGLAMPIALAAQDSSDPASKIEAMQIGEAGDASTGADGARKAYLDGRLSGPSRTGATQDETDQIVARDRLDTPPTQIVSTGESGSPMVQLSGAELEATLAQLTPSERRVLLQAIEGSDICDNPPNVPAIIALCRSRLETRSDEFAAREEQPLSAEERLIRGDLDNTGLPSVERVIERLSRANSASSNDFNNQAIASIALAPTQPPERPDNEENPTGLGLGSETEALINAIVQQLGGAQGGGP